MFKRSLLNEEGRSSRNLEWATEELLSWLSSQGLRELHTNDATTWRLVPQAE